MKPFGVQCLILVCAVSGNVALLAANPRGGQQHNSPAPLFTYMTAMTSRLDCYYTVEVLFPTSGPTDFDGIQVSNDMAIRNVADLVTKLKKDLPKRIVVLRDTTNPKVIHFVDRSLVDDVNYPLNRAVTLSYSGKVFGLPDFIGANIKQTLTAQHVYFNGADIDKVTKVKVEAVNETVRSVLTNCLPIKSYDHYLWNVRVSQENDQPFYAVSFSGPASRASSDSAKRQANP